MEAEKQELLQFETDLAMMELTFEDLKGKMIYARKRIRSLKRAIGCYVQLNEPGTFIRSESKRNYDKRIRLEKKNLHLLRQEVEDIRARLREEFNFDDTEEEEFVPYEIPDPPPIEITDKKLAGWRITQTNKKKGVEVKWLKREKKRLTALIEKERDHQFMKQFF